MNETIKVKIMPLLQSCPELFEYLLIHNKNRSLEKKANNVEIKKIYKL